MMLKRAGRRVGRGWVLFLSLVGVTAGLTYGIAQGTQVTQAEWAVYMVQALGLDWNLPPKPKSHDYLARLNWKASIDFPATRADNGVGGSGAEERYLEATALPLEAHYRLATLRPGEYGFRVRVAGGGAVLKVGGAVFEIFQPDPEFRWVDLDGVPLDPGSHSFSLLLSEGARAERLAVTPPCVLSVEPSGGWQLLEPLRAEDMAVTVAKVLELESLLPAIGPATVIKGEEFVRTLDYPLEEGGTLAESDPFWLNSGGSIISARVRFTAPVKGLYSLESRYLSPQPVRWIVDGCLRVITCQVTGTLGTRWTRTTALELEAGEHEIEITLPPRAALDQVTIQRRDGSPEEYLRVVEDQGFRPGRFGNTISRRDVITAARRLRSVFERSKAFRCNDTLVAMEKTAALRLAASISQSESDSESTSGGERSNLPPLDPTTRGGGADAPSPDGSGDPLIPKGDPEPPPPSSPVDPGR